MGFIYRAIISSRSSYSSEPIIVSRGHFKHGFFYGRAQKRHMLVSFFLEVFRVSSILVPKQFSSSNTGIGPGKPPDLGGWFSYELAALFWKYYTRIFCYVYFSTYNYKICDLLKNFNAFCN